MFLGQRRMDSRRVRSGLICRHRHSSRVNVAATEELQEGQVRESCVAFLFDRGTPMLHCAQPAALQVEAEATTVEAHLYLTGVPGGNTAQDQSTPRIL